MMSLIKTIGIGLVIGLAIVLLITFSSEAIFGDLTNTDSFKPLWIIVPVVSVVFYWLYKKVNSK